MGIAVGGGMIAHQAPTPRSLLMIIFGERVIKHIGNIYPSPKMIIGVGRMIIFAKMIT
jgi:hypothetical protein